MMTSIHTRLLVSKFAECVRFYRDVLGLTLKWGDENSGYASFAQDFGSSPALALFQREEMSAVIGTADLPLDTTSQDKVMLIVEVENVEAEAARIRHLGAVVFAGPTDFPEWGYRGAYLRDPDGTLIELVTDLPKQQWSDDLKAADEKLKK